MASGNPSPASGRTDKSMALLKRREGIAAQVADGEAVLLDIESGEYFALNTVGSRIWELCDGTKSTADIVSVICTEFDAAEDIVTADVAEILSELEQVGLLVPA
jgi:hypothetical protein